MIFFYGTRAAKGRTIETPIKCPNCEGEHPMVLLPYHRYAHLMWVPMFPLGKEFIWACTNCQAGYDTSQIPVPAEVRRKVKLRWWTFLGLILIAVFILSAQINGLVENSGTRSFLHNPVVGDIYEVKYSDSQYSFMKVMAMDSDSVYFCEHEYYTDSRSGLRDLRNEYPDAYYTDPENIFGVARSRMYAVFDKDMLLKITRTSK